MLNQSVLKQILVSGNVPFIQGKAGISKSASMKRIADENGWKYIDIRLSQKDETEVGGFPYREFNEKLGEQVLKYALPAWFVEACESKVPVLLHFEELNRAHSYVRNACLEILNERTLNNVKLPDTVYMCASGNLGGDEDNCDVEELDAAVRNRLVILTYEPGLNQWMEEFAQKNVHPLITTFLKMKPEHYYKMHDDFKAIATPRSWTNLSKFIYTNVPEDKINDPVTLKEICNIEVLRGFVGASAQEFYTFLDDGIKYSYVDILTKYHSDKLLRMKVENSTISMRTAVLEDMLKGESCDMNSIKEEERFCTLDKYGYQGVQNLAEFLTKVDQEVAYKIFSELLNMWSVPEDFYYRYKKEDNKYMKYDPTIDATPDDAGILIIKGHKTTIKDMEADTKVTNPRARLDLGEIVFPDNKFVPNLTFNHLLVDLRKPLEDEARRDFETLEKINEANKSK